MSCLGVGQVFGRRCGGDMAALIIVQQENRHWNFERALSCPKHCRGASMDKCACGLSSLEIPFLDHDGRGRT